RVRLTLWYTGAMVVVLGVYAAGVYAFVAGNVSESLNDQLRSDFQWPQQMLESLPNGRISPNDENVEADSSNPWLQMWSPAGELLYSTWYARQMPIPFDLVSRSDGAIAEIPGSTPKVRVLSGSSKIGGQPVVVQVAKSERAMQEELHKLFLIFLLGLPL